MIIADASRSNIVSVADQTGRENSRSVRVKSNRKVEILRRYRAVQRAAAFYRIWFLPTRAKRCSLVSFSAAMCTLMQELDKSRSIRSPQAWMDEVPNLPSLDNVAFTTLDRTKPCISFLIHVKDGNYFSEGEKQLKFTLAQRRRTPITVPAFQADGYVFASLARAVLTSYPAQVPRRFHRVTARTSSRVFCQ